MMIPKISMNTFLHHPYFAAAAYIPLLGGEDRKAGGGGRRRGSIGLETCRVITEGNGVGTEGAPRLIEEELKYTGFPSLLLLA